MTTPEDTSVEAVLLWAAYHGYTAIYNGYHLFNNQNHT